MSDSSTTPESSTAAEVGWQPRGDVRLFWAGDERLEATLDELAAMSAAEPPRTDFVPALLQVAATAVNASAAAIWIAGPGKELTLQLQYQRGDDAVAVERRGVGVEFSRLTLQVEEAHSTGQAATAHTADGSRDVLMFLCPWRVKLGTSGVVGIAIPEEVSTDARQSAQQFTHAISAIAADYFRNVRLHELSAEQGVWREFEEFTLAVHASNDVDRVASAIVNEGRRLVGADRMSLATCERGDVSPDSDQRRDDSQSPRQFSAADGRAEPRGGDRWGSGVAAKRCGASAAGCGAAGALLRGTHARTIAVTPLVSRSEVKAEHGLAIEAAAPAGVLIAEWFESSEASAAAKARLGVVCRQSEAAIAHVLDVDRLPFVRVNRWLAKVVWLTEARQWRRTKIWAAAVFAVIAFFAICPASFEVEADGELQPVERRELFASLDGVVQSALVDHGEHVMPGQVLARLRSPALELETARVNGERQTAEKRLAAVRTARLELDQDGGGEASGRYLQLTAEEEEIKQLLTSLGRQNEILERQQRDLEVTSPIKGQVLTWDAQRAG